MSGYIPLEVQEEILKWLPVKPLVQFRSVSKTWKSLIDSPQFFAAYGVRQTHPNRLILRYKDIIDSKKKYLTFVDNDNNTFIKQDFVPTVPSLIKTLARSNVVGSSRGLWCFNVCSKCRGKKIVVIWNPVINKSIGIEIIFMCDYSSNIAAEFIGFGVCPVTLDPIIVKIEYLGRGNPWKVGVFTLSTGTWSIQSTNLLRKPYKLIGSQVVIDRFIYWLAYDFFGGENGKSRFVIILFDLTAKEFKEINVTGSLTNQLYWIRAISKLRESLVLLAYHKESEKDPPVRSLWKMKEQGISNSFRKLYTINLPHTRVKRLLGFRNTGDLILETKQKHKQRELGIYEPNSGAIDNLGIVGKDYSFMCCMETLLLHDQLDGFIYFTNN
uniref:F-box protein At1g53790-like n=1 Tax=Erigeron canadensis TaxID=72917 RepID=UPI001CB8EFDD|nr:F-box protein At1g53790-like [Erigeron canadensis]